MKKASQPVDDIRGPAQSTETDKGAGPGTGSGASRFSVEGLEGFLLSPLKGLVEGYGCSLDNGFLVDPGELVVVDQSYGVRRGAYKCCRLGFGGWGMRLPLCARRPKQEGRSVQGALGVPGLVRGRTGVPLESDRFISRVAERAELLSSLRHPHLVRLLGFSRASPLVVYEYAPGGTLEALVSRGWRMWCCLACSWVMRCGIFTRGPCSRGCKAG